MVEVRILDGIVRIKYVNDVGKLAAWLSASHIEKAPKSKRQTRQRPQRRKASNRGQIMGDNEETIAESGNDIIESSKSNSLVFISHDTRDGELAEAFSKLLTSVSANMIKSFRSSDKSGKEGIDFGDEWYTRLMDNLQSTKDIVCLFTERSLDRPWILFEAGVARGKMNTKVIGLALGVPLSKVSSGPFYQFQNMEASEEDLRKLLNQLARRFTGLE